MVDDATSTTVPGSATAATHRCGDGRPTHRGTGRDDDPAASATGSFRRPAAQLETASVALQKFVELPLLTAVVQHPDRSLWFTSQTGEVWKMVEGGQPEIVLDLRPRWRRGPKAPSGACSASASTRSTDGCSSTSTTPPATRTSCRTHSDADGRPDPASRWEVLFVDQPGIGHKGGGIVFDENGVMMLALGDGGGSRGRDAQDYSKLLGGIIRIIPRTSGPGYDIPGDNPFIGQEGIAPELFAKGLRNPWGFCRDAPTGDMWITDVGEDTVEEVNHIPAGTSGMNFGWYFLEGTQVRYDGAPQPNQPPIWEYLHNQFGPASIGGCVYRGAAIPALQGAYVFSDMSGPMFAIGEGYAPVRLPPARAGPHRHGREDGRRRRADHPDVAQRRVSPGPRVTWMHQVASFGGDVPVRHAGAVMPASLIARLRLVAGASLAGRRFGGRIIDRNLSATMRPAPATVECGGGGRQRADPTTMTETTTQVAVNGGSDRGGNGATILDRVVVRFAGDSGDGMQLTGDRFTSVSASYGNDLSTLPEFPAEIRAPAGTVHGVSSFQVHISDHPITTPGDEPNVLVAMNPAALRADLGRLEPGGTLIVNEDAFDDRNLEKAGYTLPTGQDDQPAR